MAQKSSSRTRGVTETMGMRFATWNIGSMTAKEGELVNVLEKRKVQLCCMQETKWKGEGKKWMGKYRFYWKGQERAETDSRSRCRNTNA